VNRVVAQTLSYLLHPAVYPIIGVLVTLRVLPFHITAQVMLWSLSLVFIGTYILPMAITYWMFRMGYVASLEMANARDRRIPYLVGALCYYLVATTMKSLPLPVESYLFIIASTLVIVIHLFCLGFTKPSAHMGGIGGFTGLIFALSLQYQLNLLLIIGICLVVSGFLASARLYLDAHTVGELIFGYISGFLIVFVLVFFVA
jgi:membrane-associated phospholipid phosphatase